MATEPIKNEIAEQEFFAGLDSTAIAYLAEHAHKRAVDKDTTLFCHGNRAESFYLLCSGHVSIEVAAIQGPPLQLQYLGPGKILGWSWLIPPYRWHFQARAEEAAEVIEFDGQAILAHCEADPVFGYQLLKRFSALMSKRLEQAREEMMEAWNPSGFG